MTMRPSAGPPELVYESEFYRVEHYVATRVVLVTRKPKEFANRDGVDAACIPVQAALDRLGRVGKRLLVDSRLGPMRNDPESEANFAGHRARMAAGFDRVAIVIRTIVGKLQTERLSGEIKSANLRAFMDMSEAMAHLTR